MTRPPILDRLSDLSDATRSRLLLALDRHELTVSELCSVLQLPQSTVSRHLRVLADQGWVRSRAEGTSRLYIVAEELEPAARRLWALVREQMGETPGARHDAERLRGVLAERRTASRAFFSAAAGQWDGMRAELFGRHAELAALPALLDDAWTVGDLGCGTGQTVTVLAPFVRRVVGVDASRQMLAAARRRTSALGNVELRHGDLEALPVANGELDAALLLLVLHHVPEPKAVLAQARRALAAGGRLLVVDMVPHERDEYRRQMGHVWLGFGEEQLGRWLADVGFTQYRYHPLPADPQAKGPVLFAASARAG
jgi:ArsR family transcriptional regulator